MAGRAREDQLRRAVERLARSQDVLTDAIVQEQAALMALANLPAPTDVKALGGASRFTSLIRMVTANARKSKRDASALRQAAELAVRDAEIAIEAFD